MISHFCPDNHHESSLSFLCQSHWRSVNFIDLFPEPACWVMDFSVLLFKVSLVSVLSFYIPPPSCHWDYSAFHFLDSWGGMFGFCNETFSLFQYQHLVWDSRSALLSCVLQLSIHRTFGFPFERPLFPQIIQQCFDPCCLSVIDLCFEVMLFHNILYYSTSFKFIEVCFTKQEIVYVVMFLLNFYRNVCFILFWSIVYE